MSKHWNTWLRVIKCDFLIFRFFLSLSNICMCVCIFSWIFFSLSGLKSRRIQSDAYHWGDVWRAVSEKSGRIIYVQLNVRAKRENRSKRKTETEKSSLIRLIFKPASFRLFKSFTFASFSLSIFFYIVNNFWTQFSSSSIQLTLFPVLLIFLFSLKTKITRR